MIKPVAINTMMRSKYCGKVEIYVW